VAEAVAPAEILLKKLKKNKVTRMVVSLSPTFQKGLAGPRLSFLV